MRDELRECLKELEAVREAGERRQDYLLTLVHEFRNPLTAVAGSVEILEDKLADRMEPREREFFDVINAGLARLNQMLDEMLELTALEGRSVGLRTAPTDFPALLQTIMVEYEPRARLAGVTLKPVEAVGEVPLVECDPELMGRVISNLISNGIKYNRAGGSVTATVSAQDGTLRVDVADTGAGIREEDYPKIFTRFYRAADVREKKIAGTGLGLTIARKIVEFHQGEMWFTSAYGAGSTFTFTIPVAGPRDGTENGDEPVQE
ncbi:MAG: HAMP domain-containing sensor histidine kinase [Candidatus Zixiibacteriota bacterium]|jgi:two-component system sensor histidine kinase ResE